MDTPVSCGLVERRSERNGRFDDGTIVFFANGRRDLPSGHNRPLYVTAIVRVELKSAMLD